MKIIILSYTIPHRRVVKTRWEVWGKNLAHMRSSVSMVVKKNFYALSKMLLLMYNKNDSIY